MSSDQTRRPDGPDETDGPEVPHTEVTESDPNADGPEGLAGDMGVSSERLGTVRGGGEPVTYTTGATHTDAVDDGAPTGDEAPPEQSSRDPRADVEPDAVAPHESDPDRNPRHGV